VSKGGVIVGLKDKIQEDIKTAMKAKDAARLSVLRMVMAEIKNQQAQVNLREELPEADVLKVVGAYQKSSQKVWMITHLGMLAML
jgi:uncharacterized protein YqeY